LSLVVGGRLSHTFPLRGEMKLGREKGNAVVVADQKVSRHHATLTPIDDTFIISDLGSANGTYINGVLIAQPTRLKHNDRIGIGDATFLYTIGQPDPNVLEASPSPPPSVVHVQPSSKPGPMLNGNTPFIWTLVGCMALIIIGLLFIMAVLVGLFIGSSNLVGLLG
jgi:predicted component of type VI protein secretion system